ncbi:MAG: 6-phosphofructokinase [Alistipes sp.]|nr:6-phosphofructokinase [Alistipes sp.]MBR3827317.1 6-phosphofructokinase [Alistipes sp.]
MKEAIAILTGGGPAPGMNTVVGSVAKTFLAKGYRVIGLHYGYSGLFNPNPRYEDLDMFRVDYIFNQGGSYLTMSRFKPSEEDFEKNFNLDFFKDNNIKLLVTVGGDDTASTANRIAKFLEKKQYPIANIHVPKTIDNDLPLPAGMPTFGYQSAKNAGSVIGRAVYNDARTSANWFVVAAMGRSAGHLAFGIASACHYPMIIIPEMFNKTKITIDKIVSLIVSAIVKRKLLGMDYGAAMVSEGVFHALDEEEILKSGIHFSYDDHGHPELGKVSKAEMFNTLLEKRCKALGLKVKSRPVEIGYEVRCQTPCAFDLVYCSQLGMGVYKLFSEGKTGCMVYISQEGYVSPLYLKDLQDPETGKIPPRLVDINADKIHQVIDNLMHYITPADYEAAKAYLPNPEEYDFKKILCW